MASQAAAVIETRASTAKAGGEHATPRARCGRNYVAALLRAATRLGERPARVPQILQALARVLLEASPQQRGELDRQVRREALPIRLSRQHGGEDQRDVLTVEGRAPVSAS